MATERSDQTIASQTGDTEKRHVYINTAVFLKSLVYGGMSLIDYIARTYHVSREHAANNAEEELKKVKFPPLG